MPFVIVRVEVQIADPAGITTVSPSLASPMAVLTFANETLTALITAGCVWAAASVWLRIVSRILIINAACKRVNI